MSMSESRQREEGNGAQIPTPWPRRGSGKMDLAYGPRTRKQLIPGRVTPSPMPLYIKLEATLPFVSWRLLLYKQTHDAQVQLPLLLEVLGPFFRLSHSAPSQPTCPCSIQNLDSPLIPLLQSFCWRIQNWLGLPLTVELITQLSFITRTPDGAAASDL